MLRKVFIILCLVICLICLSLFTYEYTDKKEGENFYQNVLPSSNLIDVNELKSEYEEAMGYISINGTNISYPIVQGNDNSYYLKHLPNGESNKMGSIFLDYRNNDFNDQNTVIYGHNFNNGTMFSDLLNYRSDDFYKEHMTYIIYTSNEKIEVKIFGVYIVDATKKEIPINFANDDELNDYLTNNIIDSDIEISSNDKLITLCTCANGSWENRLLVVGRAEKKV